MTEDRYPTQELRAGRRELEGMTGVGLLQDYTWSGHAQRWVLRCRLRADVAPEGPVPAETDWYVLVGEEYPWGTIGFYPAKQGGIAETFPHQEYNAPGAETVPWRKGKLCLDTSGKILGLHGQSGEPAGPDYRLAWHFRRARCWLELASRGELLVPGDPFELPRFPKGGVFEAVAFAEGEEQYRTWQEIPQRSGLIEYAYLNARPPTIVVRAFLSARRRPLLTPTWGDAIASTSDSIHLGVWMRLPQTPVLPPWQAPVTWGELRQVCANLHIDLDPLLESAAQPIRDGARHIALIGWPIPARVGDAPRQMHWQAIRLPALSHGKQSAKGFRPQMGGYARRDRAEVLRDDVRLDWSISENWHPDQLSSRGRLPEEFAARRTLLIGAGALGSVLAEMLVRAGVHRLVLMDDDAFAAGNLARHTLGMRELLSPKARCLAQHLNAVSPHAKVKSFDQPFPPRESAAENAVKECEVIIDCTGSEEVPAQLAQADWQIRRHFFSISFGLYARRLYFFFAYAERFPHEAFRSALAPWLRDDRERYATDQLPWEGIGCWHPVFPARVDDVWLLSATAVKLLERKLIAPTLEPGLIVLEQSVADGEFGGVRVAETNADRG